MSANKIIAEVLSAPLPSDWTVEGLAARLLDAIVSQPSDEPQSFVVDEATDRQASRLIRPLLAYLAQTSATESNIYGGPLSFTLARETGNVDVTGDFVNRIGNVRLSLRSSICAFPINGSRAELHSGREQFAS